MSGCTFAAVQTGLLPVCENGWHAPDDKGLRCQIETGGARILVAGARSEEDMYLGPILPVLPSEIVPYDRDAKGARPGDARYRGRLIVPVMITISSPGEGFEIDPRQAEVYCREKSGDRLEPVGIRASPQVAEPFQPIPVEGHLGNLVQLNFALPKEPLAYDTCVLRLGKLIIGAPALPDLRFEPQSSTTVRPLV